MAGFAIAYALHLADNPDIPVYLANIPMGVAFFMLGHSLSRYETEKWLYLPCMVAYIAFLLTDTPVVGLHRNVHLGGIYILWPLFSYCGIVAFNAFCRWLRSALDNAGLQGFRPFSFLGRNSMTLLVTHAFIYQLVIHYSTLSPVATFCIVAAAYLFLLIPAVLVFGPERRHRA